MKKTEKSLEEIKKKLKQLENAKSIKGGNGNDPIGAYDGGDVNTVPAQI